MNLNLNQPSTPTLTPTPGMRLYQMPCHYSKIRTESPILTLMTPTLTLRHRMLLPQSPSHYCTTLALALTPTLILTPALILTLTLTLSLRHRHWILVGRFRCGC